MKIWLLKKLFDQEENSIVVGVYANPVKAITALKEYKDRHKVNVEQAAECRVKCRHAYYDRNVKNAEEYAASMCRRCDRADIIVKQSGDRYYPECRNDKRQWYYIDGYRLDAVEAVE